MLEIIAPSVSQRLLDERLIIISAEMITDSELAETALPAGFESLANENQGLTESGQNSKAEERIGSESIDQPIKAEQQGRIEWVFQDGKWVPVQIGRPVSSGEVPLNQLEKIPAQTLNKSNKEELPSEFDWEEIGMGGMQRRVIKIDADRLRGGDPRHNIVIKAGDSIQVPVDIIGEFCIMGNVNFQGFVNLTGRPMTLKMAIASAGGLGQLAWPKRCEVVRRIGRKKEEIVMVDLDKIASGEQPDFFIKPNDLINVGTHSTARWRAVLRNAFRATYGFGFIYDRNFADRDYGTRRPIPDLW